MSFNLNVNSENIIILTNNIINNNNEGTLIYLNSAVIPKSQLLIDEVATFIGALPNSNNRIILSYSLRSNNDNFRTTSKNCLLTLNNIKNNMKFLFSDSKKKGKLLFIKNNNNYEKRNNYLINFTTTP